MSMRNASFVILDFGVPNTFIASWTIYFSIYGANFRIALNKFKHVVSVPCYEAAIENI
jgi:hypothetical protein